MAVVEHISDRVAVMYLGRVVEEAGRETHLRRPAPPVHAGAHVGDPPARSRRAPPAHHPARRRAQPDQHSAGLPLPPALLALRAARTSPKIARRSSPSYAGHPARSDARAPPVTTRSRAAKSLDRNRQGDGQLAASDGGSAPAAVGRLATASRSSWAGSRRRAWRPRLAQSIGIAAGGSSLHAVGARAASIGRRRCEVRRLWLVRDLERRRRACRGGSGRSVTCAMPTSVLSASSA